MYLDARTSVIGSLGVTWDVVHGDVHTGQFVDKGQTVSRLHVFETDCMHHENPCEGHLPVQYTFFEVAEELRSSVMMAGCSKGGKLVDCLRHKSKTAALDFTLAVKREPLMQLFTADARRPDSTACGRANDLTAIAPSSPHAKT